MGRTTALKSFMVKPVSLTEARTLTDSDSGKTYFLNAAGGFTVTLPVPRGGVNFEFIVKTAPTTGSYAIATNAGAKIIKGMAITSNVKTATDAGLDIGGVGHMYFAIPDAKVGDSMKFVSDGTYWYALGFCGAYSGISIGPSASSSVSTSVSSSISPSSS